jgi:hypothetical protein
LRDYTGVEFRSSLGANEKLTLNRLIYPKQNESIILVNNNDNYGGPYSKLNTNVNFSLAYDLFADTFLGRINQSHIFSIIYYKTIEYEYGRTFIIPFLNPNVIKINESTSSIWIRSGLVEYNEKTSIGTTLYGDLYRNFSLIGVFIGVTLLGIAFRFVNTYYYSPSIPKIIIYCSLFPFLIFSLEGTIDAYITNLFKFFISFLIIYLINLVKP